MISQAKAGIRRLLPKNAFARSVSVLVGGTASAQALLVLAAPLLTRLYSPDDFGLLAVYASLLAIIGVIASLRYELAIPLPEGDAEAANVAVLSLLLVVGSTLLSALAVLLFSEPIATALGVPKMGGYLWLLPVGVLLGGAYTVFNYWSIRTKRFTTIAATKLRQALATIVIQLTAFNFGGIALLFGQVAGQSVGSASLGRPALRNPGFKQVNMHGIRQAAGRYRRFPMFTTWAGLINTAGHQLPPLMFAALFSIGAAGLYALAHRVLMLPSALIGSAIGNVFFGHAAEAHRAERLGHLYANVQDKLIQIGLPPALILIIIGPTIFELVFGQSWRQAGEFAQLLAVSIFAAFVVSPLSMIFTILEKQHIGLILQSSLFLLRMAAILAGAWIGDITTTVALFSVASLLGYSLYIVVGARYAGIGLTRFWVSLFRSLLYSFVVVSPILLSLISENMAMFYGMVCISFVLVFVRYIMIVKRVDTGNSMMCL